MDPQDEDEDEESARGQIQDIVREFCDWFDGGDPIDECATLKGIVESLGEDVGDQDGLNRCLELALMGKDEVKITKNGCEDLWINPPLMMLAVLVSAVQVQGHQDLDEVDMSPTDDQGVEINGRELLYVFDPTLFTFWKRPAEHFSRYTWDNAPAAILDTFAEFGAQLDPRLLGTLERIAKAVQPL